MISGAVDHLAAVLDKAGQQREFLGGQLDVASTTGDAAPRKVDLEVRDLDGLGLHLPRPARQRPDAGQQLAKCERLGEIVVRTNIQSGDPVIHRIARREHQDRRRHAAGAQLAAEVEARPTGQHHVEHDDTEVGIASAMAGVGQGGGAAHLIAMLAEADRDHFGEFGVVFHEQQAHMQKIAERQKGWKRTRLSSLHSRLSVMTSRPVRSTECR